MSEHTAEIESIAAEQKAEEFRTRPSLSLDPLRYSSQARSELTNEYLCINRKEHYRNVAECAELLAALENCVTVMDEACRTALKELTDLELGKLWLTTVDQAKMAIAKFRSRK